MTNMRYGASLSTCWIVGLCGAHRRNHPLMFSPHCNCRLFEGGVRRLGGCDKSWSTIVSFPTQHSTAAAIQILQCNANLSCNVFHIILKLGFGVNSLQSRESVLEDRNSRQFFCVNEMESEFSNQDILGWLMSDQWPLWRLSTSWPDNLLNYRESNWIGIIRVQRPIYVLCSPLIHFTNSMLSTSGLDELKRQFGAGSNFVKNVGSTVVSHFVPSTPVLRSGGVQHCSVSSEQWGVAGEENWAGLGGPSGGPSWP